MDNDFILLETLNYLLQENGGKLLLEQQVVSPSISASISPSSSVSKSSSVSISSSVSKSLSFSISKSISASISSSPSPSASISSSVSKSISKSISASISSSQSPSASISSSASPSAPEGIVPIGGKIKRGLYDLNEGGKWDTSVKHYTPLSEKVDPIYKGDNGVILEEEKRPLAKKPGKVYDEKDKTSIYLPDRVILHDPDETGTLVNIWTKVDPGG